VEVTDVGRTRWEGNSPLETAGLALHLIGAKEAEGGRKLSRIRMSELTFRALSDRTRMSPEFLLEVQEFLSKAGWILFWAGSGYALVRQSAVEGWTRVSAKRIKDVLQAAKIGDFGRIDIPSLFSSFSEVAESNSDDDE
jgi:hypothetical protein